MAAAATQPVPMAGAVGAVPMLEGGQDPAKPAGDEGDEDEVMEDPDAAPLGVMPSLNALCGNFDIILLRSSPLASANVVTPAKIVYCVLCIV